MKKIKNFLCRIPFVAVLSFIGVSAFAKTLYLSFDVTNTTDKVVECHPRSNPAATMQPRGMMNVKFQFELAQDSPSCKKNACYIDYPMELHWDSDGFWGDIGGSDELFNKLVSFVKYENSGAGELIDSISTSCKFVEQQG